ncbi:conserved hypothetical protein [Anaeromyxobacter dehalogenans 2CP-1]|uniref:Outer membrane protein beta-barrel domain-containing protein n=1 Tax=Anaeromyxobacter dehalogenans (strain ATCC BAA-258 / DSM 21875 / 2CP-1) TaxID=455488 RepID=B8JAK8_ANAD2|nr:hypothetical protein [Anaeromyxobacter dehalogenans]ACL67507.1 conserved hypothetical protein [Anaeromyxobacter dehalogenans 2CP-1]
MRTSTVRSPRAAAARAPFAIALALACAVPAAAAAAAPAPGPSGFSVLASLGGGGELGLDHGQAGVMEIEAVPGLELPGTGLRLEAGLALGLEPDTHFGFRPGARYQLPRLPFQVRVAFDASNSRGDGMRWRWLLVGLSTEVRLTGAFGLFAEADTGAPLAGRYGLPLLVRGGASFRF